MINQSIKTGDFVRVRMTAGPGSIFGQAGNDVLPGDSAILTVWLDPNTSCIVNTNFAMVDVLVLAKDRQPFMMDMRNKE